MYGTKSLYPTCSSASHIVQGQHFQCTKFDIGTRELESFLHRNQLNQKNSESLLCKNDTK